MKPLITIFYKENSSSVIANMAAAQRANTETEAESKFPQFRIKLTAGKNDKVHLSSVARNDHFIDAVLCRNYLNRIRTGRGQD